MNELDVIRDRVGAATKGPWFGDFDGRINVAGSEDRVCWTAEDSSVVAWRSDEDLEFIANARTDIPKLLEVIAALDEMAGCWLDGHKQDHHYGRMIRHMIAETLS